MNGGLFRCTLSVILPPPAPWDILNIYFSQNNFLGSTEVLVESKATSQVEMWQPRKLALPFMGIVNPSCKLIASMHFTFPKATLPWREDTKR